jgi:hypothetical protein
MMGTPGRPGITMSKPPAPPAKAVAVVPIKIASAKAARMVGRPKFCAHPNPMRIAKG